MIKQGLILVLLTFGIYFQVKSQVVISNAAVLGQIDNSAELKVASASNLGVLFPILTSLQMYSISSPDSAVLIYNSTNSAFEFYNGASWEIIGTIKQYSTAGLPTGSPTLVTGQLIYNTTTNKLNFYNGTAWYYLNASGNHYP